MKAKDIISNYCQLYGVAMPTQNPLQGDYFVAIDSSQARIYTHHRSPLLGRIIGDAMKRGVVLYVRGGWVKPLLWENWKQIWSRYFAPEPRKGSTLPEPHRKPRERYHIFEQARNPRPHKRQRTGGFEATFRGNMNINLMGTPIPSLPL